MRLLIFIISILFVPAGLVQAQNIKTINEDGVISLIKKRNDKPLVINFWATWCIPCKEEYPDIVKLSEKYDKIEFIGISLDKPSEVVAKIKPFLKSMNAKFTNYVGKFRSVESLVTLINNSWTGAIPGTVVYNPEGKQIFFHEGQISYSELEKVLTDNFPSATSEGEKTGSVLQEVGDGGSYGQSAGSSTDNYAGDNIDNSASAKNTVRLPIKQTKKCDTCRF